MFVQWALLIVCSIVLNMIFNVVKRLKVELNYQVVAPDEPLNTVDFKNQLGHSKHTFTPLTATIYSAVAKSQ